ncbi:MAG: hypothetical protein JSU74_01020 [Candidatus Zixiibacteriota bacterium]|nr:MAG: hypothetical protein JSU74_01020 [candidate division Zixibacteria bacterium]
MNSDVVTGENRIRIFRWFFYIGLTQQLMYYIVPAFVFPKRLLIDIEIVSALTLGLLVSVFFMLVNIAGLFLDKSRRVLYGLILAVLTTYLIWVIVSWAYIERMDYLLR